MDLKLNRETIAVSEKIYDGVQEQSVELDYILPDYYPDIFKLVKCCVTTMIVSYSVNGDSVSYELAADIKILYCSEQSNTMQCISQKMNYSKTVQMGKSCIKPSVTICPKTDYVNCRVVNQRRLDMRGAISVKISITGESSQEVISDIFGMNVQMKKMPVEYAAKKITASRTVSVSEEVDLNMSKPPVISVIRSSAVLSATDKKIISGKLIVKGEAALNVLYTCEGGLETMQFTLPYSQIVDMDGLSEEYQCSVRAQTASLDITPTASADGDARKLQCELNILLECSAVKVVATELVTDVYSTAYKCDFSSSPLKIQQCPTSLNELFQEKTTIENSEGTIECVYDAWCIAKNINSRVDPETKSLIISGMIQYCVMIKSENAMAAMLEKDEAFEHTIQIDEISQFSHAEPVVETVSCSYTLSSSNAVSLKSDIRITGCLYTSSGCEAVTEVGFDEETKITRDGDYALKLYYGVENEDIWEIAKKYCTSVSAIMEENDLESDRLTQSGMLLIPIVC